MKSNTTLPQKPPIDRPRSPLSWDKYDDSVFVLDLASTVRRAATAKSSRDSSVGNLTKALSFSQSAKPVCSGHELKQTTETMNSTCSTCSTDQANSNDTACMRPLVSPRVAPCPYGHIEIKHMRARIDPANQHAAINCHVPSKNGRRRRSRAVRTRPAGFS